MMKEDLDRKEGAVPPGIEIPGIPARKLVNAMQRGIPHRIQTLIDKRNRESRALFERYGFTQPRPGFEYNGRYLEYVLDTESPIWDGHRP